MLDEPHKIVGKYEVYQPYGSYYMHVIRCICGYEVAAGILSDAKAAFLVHLVMEERIL